MYNRVNHIDTHIYHIRELSESGEVNRFKVDGENQPVDIFTESLTRPSFMMINTLSKRLNTLKCLK